jgi:hypothetical protein
MKLRQQLLRLRLRSAVVSVLAKNQRCDCGQPARYVAIYDVVTIEGHTRQDAMMLCEACAGLATADTGMRLVKLE